MYALVAACRYVASAILSLLPSLKG